MSKLVIFDDREYVCEDSETILQAINRKQKIVPHSCRNGLCQTCLLRKTEGDIPPVSQIGLKDILVKKGYFLACTCVPETDLRISWPKDHDLFGHATVLTKEFLAPDICRLTLETSLPLFYHAGQFINLKRSNRVIRSYSIASVPSLDKHLEIHIKRKENGKLSNWIFERVEPWKNIDIQGPAGECYYRPEFTHRNLLLIATGTGIAPLSGIVRDALNSQHQGEIHLYHGSHDTNGVYLHQYLRHLQQQNKNLTYHGCISGNPLPDHSYRQGRADDFAFTDLADLKGWIIFLAGMPLMVRNAQIQAQKSGANIDDIFAEPFDLNELRLLPRKE